MIYSRIFNCTAASWQWRRWLWQPHCLRSSWPEAVPNYDGFGAS